MLPFVFLVGLFALIGYGAVSNSKHGQTPGMIGTPDQYWVEAVNGQMRVKPSRRQDVYNYLATRSATLEGAPVAQDTDSVIVLLVDPRPTVPDGPNATMPAMVWVNQVKGYGNVVLLSLDAPLLAGTRPGHEKFATSVANGGRWAVLV